MFAIQSPYPQFYDRNGDVLDAGYVHIGAVNQNPQTSHVAVYWDEAGTQPAAQPLRTVAGYISRNGSPANAYISADDYSMTVTDRNGVLIYTTQSVLSVLNLRQELASTSAGNGAEMVAFKQSGAGAVDRTASDKLREVVSVKDFGAVGDGVTDDSAAIQAAIDAVKKTGNLARAGAPNLFFPSGTYVCASTLNIDAGHIRLLGENSTIQYTGSANAIFVGSALYLTDLAAGYFYAGFSGIVVKCTNTAAKCVVNHGYRKLEFENTYLRDGAVGLETEGCFASGIFRNSVCQNQSSHGIHIKQRNNLFTIENSAVLGAGGNGVLLSTSGAELKSIKLWGVDIEGCAGAINITGNTGNVLIDSCWFENNNTYNIRVSNEAGDSNKYGISICNCQITGAGDDVLIGTSTTGTLISGVTIGNNEFADSDLIVVGGSKVDGLVEFSNTYSATATKTIPASGLATVVSGVQPLFQTAPLEPFGFSATGRQGELRYSATAGRVWVKASGGSSSGGWLLVQGQQVNDYANQLAPLPTGVTPSVANRLACRTNNDAPTSITSFSDGYASQELLIVGNDGGNTTIVHGTNIRLAGGVNFVLGTDDAIRLLCVDGTKWVEVSRSNYS